MIRVSMIVACTIDGGIGNGNRLPWDIPTEMKKFRNITIKTKCPTKKNAVIMGRRTWESMGEKMLKGRYNIVLSTTLITDEANGLIVRKNFDEALIACRVMGAETIFVIGGSKVYNELLKGASNSFLPYILDKIHLSVLYYGRDHVSDAFVSIDDVFRNFNLEKDTQYAGDNLFASFVCTNKILKQELA